MIHKVGIHRINFYLSAILLVTSRSWGTEEIVLSWVWSSKKGKYNHVIFMSKTTEFLHAPNEVNSTTFNEIFLLPFSILFPSSANSSTAYWNKSHFIQLYLKPQSVTQVCDCHLTACGFSMCLISPKEFIYNRTGWSGLFQHKSINQSCWCRLVAFNNLSSQKTGIFRLNLAPSISIWDCFCGVRELHFPNFLKLVSRLHWSH